jgi:hypothetical protein
MDSHISKGNKKTNKTNYRKNLYIFKKYLQSSFSPQGFEIISLRWRPLFAMHCTSHSLKVFHHSDGHLWGNGGNFLANSVLKCFEGLRPMSINLGLEVSPKVKIAGDQIG